MAGINGNRLKELQRRIDFIESRNHVDPRGDDHPRNREVDALKWAIKNLTESHQGKLLLVKLIEELYRTGGWKELSHELMTELKAFIRHSEQL